MSKKNSRNGAVEDAAGSDEGGARVQLFNLETMSGVYPGTRTQVYQRVRLLPLGVVDVRTEGAQQAPTWAIIYWYADPPACVVHQLDGEGQRQNAHPLLRIEAPLADDLRPRMRAALAQLGWRLFTCGECSHWQPTASNTADGLQVGRCALRAHDVIGSAQGDTVNSDPEGALVDVPELLAAQSVLALGCPHWLAEGVITSRDEGQRDAPEMNHILELAPLPRDAVTTDSKKTPMQRLTKRIKRWWRPPAARPTLTQSLAERSGVGAGTESCYSCQGRIANLGALVVASEHNDKETLSVWRCRTCHTLYLSDWIDRWERVDSLETEETIYRIAPVEAAEILTLIATVEDADHPRQRGERTVERAWVHAQMQGRMPLSHMIKQGR